MIPAIGGALSSILLIKLLGALAESESAGIVGLMAGLKEAALPAIISLYLAVFGGFIVIVFLIVRLFIQTRTGPPPSWFFIIGVILCLVPAGLFWKAQALMIETISPGSSTSVNGVAAVGADVSQLLMLSVIAAPIVILLLIIGSVVPLSTRSRTKWLPLAAAAVVGILLVSVAVSIPYLITEPRRQNEIVNLPRNVKNAQIDNDIDKETSMVLTYTAENRLYQKQNRNISDDRVERTDKIVNPDGLPEKIRASMDGKSPDRRIVYFKGDTNASFEYIVNIFKSVREGEIDKIGLVVIGEKNEDDPYQIEPRMFEVFLPNEPGSSTNEMVRPNPLTLVVMFESDGYLILNNEDLGNIADTADLENRLSQIFKDREMNAVFRENTNEVEKTLFLKVSKSANYGDLIKLVAAAKRAGAQPIGIQIDDLVE